MQATQASLVLVDLNTLSPKVFWNGVQVEGITEIKVDSELGKEFMVKLKIKGTNDTQYMEMVSAGINIKKGK
jgi:hypothetical protein